MENKDQETLKTAEEEVQQETQKPATDIKDVVQLGTTALLALYTFFTTLNVHFEWFNPQSINAFGAFVLAAVVFGAQFWVAWRNTYMTSKGIERAAKIIDKNAKKE